MAALTRIPGFPLFFLFLFSCLSVGISSCGNRIPPPGGPVDEVSPQIVSIEPDSNEVNVALDAVVRVAFDEEITIARSREGIALLPLHSGLKRKHGRDYVELRPEGGFKQGCTYSVTVSRDILDLRGNPLSEPLLFFFSTGGSIDSGIIRGHVDRHEELEGVAFLQAVHYPDSLVYTTGIKADGSYLLTHLPTGLYGIAAFVDTRRNRRYDPAEDIADVREAVLDNDELEIDFYLAEPREAPRSDPDTPAP